MRVDLFDFDLPQERIALRPMEPREAGKLLVVRPDEEPFLHDACIADLPNHLRPGDALVVNDARVIPARLRGMRRRDDSVARIEATLHQRTADNRWLAFARPAKKLKIGDRVRFGDDRDSVACLLGALDAQVVGKGEEGEVELAFDLAGVFLDEAIARVGRMPLPPYIASRRAEDERDAADYQTMFAKVPGAVAAPTAGFHFTPALAERIAARGASLHRVTLHVGAGTFLPVKAEDTAQHVMHAERAELDAPTASALNAARRSGARIVSVGTTSLRVLESAADEDGWLRPMNAPTRLFVTPGYRFRAVDALLTNFHLPRSTLFMLVSAFCGLETMKRAYAHAIERDYRFYSYGDACLLHRRVR